MPKKALRPIYFIAMPFGKKTSTDPRLISIGSTHISERVPKPAEGAITFCAAPSGRTAHRCCWSRIGPGAFP
jgi:hypothetical protein